MKSILVIAASVVSFGFCLTSADGQPLVTSMPPARSQPEFPTPLNQVFQFAQSATCTAWSDGSKNDATAYLWVPEKCERIRGLLILCANVPEHGLVGHPAIREVCRSNDLAIVWCTPTFMNFARQQPGQKKMAEENATSVVFLQQLLDGLAQKSGYGEIASVPWLPMGESGHLLMVDALVEAMPQRCIAGIWIKNNHLPPKNREVPALVAYGTAQEWSQDKTDIRSKWNDVGGAYQGIINQRKNNPGWPLSFVIDGTSGHFDCSDRLTRYFAHYIDLVAKARLSNDGSPTLKPVEIEKGYVADLPVPGHENQPVAAVANISKEERSLPWYFDESAAKEAQSIAAINWKADTQLPAFIDDLGNDLPHTFNGITSIQTAKMEADGLTFAVRGRLLDTIPGGFVGAGEKLAKAPGKPAVEWLCGPIEPLGGGRFRIALDRVWLGGGAAYVALRQAGSESIRAIVQPAGVDLKALRNNEGVPQKITFDPVAEVKAGTISVDLTAKSDAGLPVSFFVVAGPAIIQGGKLVFTAIPPRTRFPVEITVAAWQWGQSSEPKIKTAAIVEQTFRLVR